MCYLDAAGLTVTTPLSDLFDSSYVVAVCGGFYVDNFDTAGISQLETNNLYAISQVLSYLYNR